jgi:hypothetical protein
MTKMQQVPWPGEGEPVESTEMQQDLLSGEHACASTTKTKLVPWPDGDARALLMKMQ